MFQQIFRSTMILRVSALGAIAMIVVVGTIALWTPVSADDPLPPEPQTLDEAVQSVQQMLKDGKPRDVIAKWVMNTADTRITNMNSFERMSLPENFIPIWGPSMGRNKAFEDWRDQGIFEVTIP